MHLKKIAAQLCSNERPLTMLVTNPRCKDKEKFTLQDIVNVSRIMRKWKCTDLITYNPSRTAPLLITFDGGLVRQATANDYHNPVLGLVWFVFVDLARMYQLQCSFHDSDVVYVLDKDLFITKSYKIGENENEQKGSASI
jgi:hypothetical protein